MPKKLPLFNHERSDLPSYYRLRFALDSEDRPDWITLHIVIQNQFEHSIDCLGHLTKEQAREFVMLWCKMGNTVDGDNVKKFLS